MMYISKYIIYLNVDDTYSILLNALSGSILLLPRKTALKLVENKGRSISNLDLDIHTSALLHEHNYIMVSSDSEHIYRANVINKFTNIMTQRPKCYLSITNGCNSKCIYCYQGHEKDNTVIDKYAVDKAFNYSNSFFSNISDSLQKRIILYGGEPLLICNTDIVKYIFEKSYQEGYVVTVITNGNTCAEYKKLFLKYINIIDGIVTTLDGNERTHNKRRPYDNGNSFKNISNAIDDLLEIGIKVSLNIFIDWSNLYSIDELVTYIKFKEWNKNPNFNSGIGKVGFYNNDIYDYSTTITDIDFIKCSSKLYMSYSSVINNFFTGDMPPYSHLYKYALNNLGSLPKYNGCEAISPGTRLLTPNGDVYPCSQIVNDKYSIIDNYLYPNYISKDWSEYKPIANIKCRDCIYLSFCGGGCKTLNLPHNNNCTVYIHNILQTFVDNFSPLVDRLYMNCKCYL